MRLPAPSLNQSVPLLVEASKLVRQTSGLAPSRSQVMVEPSHEKVSVAGSVLLRRPMPLRVWPPSVVKEPPTTIFPSACTARAYT
jgi:hypothetical protein